MSLVLPKPAFKDCDETSLKLHWDALPATLLGPSYRITMQYKQAFLPWEQMKEKEISHTSEVVLKETDVVDLEPGTPYSVRLAVHNSADGSTVVGPEIVFDTKPIDCTPRRKRCVVS